MSLLNFLRVIDEIRSGSGKSTPLPRNRKLDLEALERRAVLTLPDPIAYVPEPLESTTTTTLESPSATDPASTTYEYSPPVDMGESGSGTGESEAGDWPQEPTYEPPPSSEPWPSTGGSGSGSGDPSPEPPPESSSGSGNGGAAPVIDSLTRQSGQFWFWLVGSVSDADDSVEGLTVFFTIGDATIPSFTAIVQEDGTFCSMQLVFLAGTIIHVHVVDHDGNPSETVTWTV